ncbi:hypothetical protein AAG906_018354 [Vitis piasezkii]
MLKSKKKFKEREKKMLLQQQPEVHHTSFGNSSSSNWIVDFGASHHVTGDLSNLSHHQPYEGPDDILLGWSKDDVYEWPWPNKETHGKHHHVVETGLAICLHLVFVFSSSCCYPTFFFVVPTPSETFPHQGLSSTTTRPNWELLSSRCPASSSPSIMTSAPLSVCDATPRYDLSSSSLPLSSNSSNTCSPSLSLSPPTQTQGSNPPLEPSHRIVTRSQNNIHCPKQFPGFKTNFHVTKHRFRIPTVSAMDDELLALAHSCTWVLVPPPSNHNIVGCKLVFHINNGWPISQLDVNNAFLHGNLTEDVNMAQPLGYVDQDNPTHVCHLQKALYGLKQAPRARYTELKTFLLNFGFINSKSDTSLFIYQCIKNSSTPMSSTGHLTLNDGSPPTNATQFRSLVGGLQYLQLTHPDIAFVVNKLAQFMHAPTQTHWTAAKRLLCYLKHTIHFGLTFQRPQPLHLQAYSNVTPPLDLQAYSNVNWVGDQDSYKSTTTFVLFLVAIQSLGVQRNRIGSLFLTRPSICRFSFLKSLGFLISFLSLVSLFNNLLLFIVII